MRFEYWHMVFIIPFFLLVSISFISAGDDMLSLNGNGKVSLSDDSIIFITDYNEDNIDITNQATTIKDGANWYSSVDNDTSKSIVDYSLQYLENKNSVTGFRKIIDSVSSIDDWIFRTLGLEDETWGNLRLALTIFVTLLITGIIFYLIFGR